MLSMVRRSLLVTLLLILPGLALASFHTLTVQQVYTNASGTVQYVLLKESSGLNGQNLLSGHALVATSSGATKTFDFPSNLPSSSTANKFVLMATQGFADLNIVTPDYTIPAGFVPIAGGSIAFAGLDTFTFGALPTDGTSALNRSGATVTNSPVNFAGVSGAVTGTATPFSASMTATGPLTAQSLAFNLTLKSTDVGQVGCRFVVAVFAGKIYMFLPAGIEQFDAAANQAHFFGALSNSSATTLIASTNLSVITGADFYVGYGVSNSVPGCLSDMIAKGTYAHIYTVR